MFLADVFILQLKLSDLGSIVFVGSFIFGSIVDVIIFHIQVLVLGDVVPL